ncbi:MAG: Na(+)-translocating NADH-quinone reductase subunit A [Candidatus Marinimicrobia bacterium]|jgi:Na+-transporting NADH:ubiquinone oxidoreductase subunit A|nr:Na(+)-translocating NADH-quinone reductase subunit A [Gammaproteobacteria bacterium]MBL6911602.1 Na(+)-translocating NADH-quinone reductase subunit A [Candidatus Neomarinimicrobiota bacterium]MBT3727660.1 Na(+)-translocating NADH-quinone reductase subunit A [Candidatus Neomarinimicrobiota bacterium]MBT3944715.1 Na(+)-translocating NADH-quinone reductase subunit A [Candidatus Neomarinimicrobiota bacterium]MBT4111818.1 Na(+)-translocating NADH-quinone reductase subunit A [Candidatus Neomarinim
MLKIKVKKGHNINIAGVASREIFAPQKNNTVSLSPENFRYIKPKLLVKENDIVKLGDPIFFDKLSPDVKWPAIASGKISKIVYGERRSIKEIIFSIDTNIENEQSNSEKKKLGNKDDVVNYLLEKNMWPFITQRPFNKVANPSDKPKCIIVSLANTAPLSVDYNFTLASNKDSLVSALLNLKKLTEGKLFVAVNPGEFDYLSDLDFIDIIQVEGPHPSGNIGVILNHVNPINKKDVVWTVQGHHLPILGKLFSDGIFDPSITINLSGPAVSNPSYFKSRIGASLESYCKGNLSTDQVRIISGDVLTGKESTMNEYLGFYHSSISIIEESFDRSFVGWLHPGGSSKYSVFNAYLGSNKSPYNFTTLQNGSHRAFVPIEAWEKVFPMNIYINALLRSIEANDFEEMEQLGIYECDEEDVALCSFVCPSKTDVGGVIRKGLDTIYFDK